MSKTITSKEAREILGITRGRLFQLRKGYLNRNKYIIKPVLIKDIDWWWEDGVIVFLEKSIIKLKKKRNK